MNATDEPQQFDHNIAGGRLAGRSVFWQLIGKTLDAVNKVGDQPQVGVKEVSLDTVPQALTVAPISVSIYSLALQ